LLKKFFIIFLQKKKKKKKKTFMIFMEQSVYSIGITDKQLLL
jgi:hypothetical protein